MRVTVKRMTIYRLLERGSGASLMGADHFL
jgi:hypothetical protein